MNIKRFIQLVEQADIPNMQVLGQLGDGFAYIQYNGMAGVLDQQTNKMILISPKVPDSFHIVTVAGGRETTQYVGADQIGPATKKALDSITPRQRPRPPAPLPSQESYESTEQVRSIVQRMMEEARVPQKPRQGPLRPQTGAGKHKDKKKDQKQGKAKHKGKELDEGRFGRNRDDQFSLGGRMPRTDRIDRDSSSGQDAQQRMERKLKQQTIDRLLDKGFKIDALNGKSLPELIQMLRESQPSIDKNGNTTDRYQAGPIDMSITKNAQGQPVHQGGTYRVNKTASINVDVPYKGGQKGITTMVGKADDPEDLDHLMGAGASAERKGVDSKAFARFQQGVREAAKKPNATTRHLRDYPVSDKDVAKPVKKPEKKKPEQGLAEMDKSQPSHGRDGKISHSTYGSRDKEGSDYFKGKEVPVKPITVKKMEKDALDILKKQGVAEGSDKLQGTPVVSLKDLDSKDTKKNKYGQTVPKKLKKDDPRVKFHKDEKQGVAEGSGKNVVKSVKVGNFRHDLVDTGMGWQVRIYNGDELYDTGMSKNSEQKGLAALEDAVAYTEKQTRTKRQGVAEGSDEGKTQKYEMMLSNGKVKRFTAKDDADAKRIAKGHGAKSVIKMKGDLPGNKIAEQGVAEATGDTKFDTMMGNIKKSAPVSVTGYVAVEYASENKSDRIKGATLKGKPMPSSVDRDDLDGEIDFEPDEIERHLIKIGRDNGWSMIDPGHGRGYSELFFDTNANYTSDNQSILAKNIVNTVNQINKFFSGLNSSLQSTGLPGYRVAVWQEISSSNGQKIGDIDQIKQIALTKVVNSPNDPGELIGKAILQELPAVEQDEYDDFTPEDFAYARKIAKIYITKGERAGLEAQISNRRMDHVSDLIDELLSLSGAQKYRTLKLDDLDEQGVAEEKQKGVDGKACWKGYKRMGTKKKGGKTVDNCVKMESISEGILKSFGLMEKSPPGFKGTVKAMKKHPELTKGKTKDGKEKNPWALAWHMKNKGYKSHKKADGSDKD